MDESKHKFDQFIEGVTYREWLKGEYEPLVKFIRDLEGILGKERTHQIVAKHNTQLGIDHRRTQMEALEKQFSSIEDVKQWFKERGERKISQMVQTKNEAPSPPGTYGFCVTECLWATVLRELDAEDLGLIIDCNTDFATTEAMHPNLRLERTKTLMQGDDCCDFVFHWDE